MNKVIFHIIRINYHEKNTWQRYEKKLRIILFYINLDNLPLFYKNYVSFLPRKLVPTFAA